MVSLENGGVIIFRASIKFSEYTKVMDVARVFANRLILLLGLYIFFNRT